MDLEVIFKEPERRRWWLLTKALENAPLEDAVKLARAADQFLVSGRGDILTIVGDPGGNHPHDDPVAAGLAHSFTLDHPAGSDDAEADAEEDAVSDDAASSVEAADLAVLATIDDVVRYLRQRDDVVVPESDGQLLVNGRFRLGPDELVERANRMRKRQGKPPFQCLPAAYHQVNGAVSAAAKMNGAAAK
jgi:hypothetical protein